MKKKNWKKGDWVIIPPKPFYKIDGTLAGHDMYGKYGIIAFQSSLWGNSTIDIFPLNTSIVPAPSFKLSEIKKPNFREKLVFIKLLTIIRLSIFLHYQKISWRELIK